MTPQSNTPEEDALPPGHPCRFDYDPASPEAAAWLAHQQSLQNNSGFPPGYTFDPTRPHGGLVWECGVDPLRPWLEPFTGRDKRRRRSTDTVDSQVTTPPGAPQPVTTPPLA